MLRNILLLLLLVFSSTTFANEFKLSYYDSKKQIKDIKKVLNKPFIETSHKKSFGNKKYIWLKATIYNKESKAKTKYLSISDIQILEDVHFFTVVNKKVIKKETSFNKYTNNDVSFRIGNNLIYENEIPAYGSIDVYIYASAKSNIYFEINVGELNEVITKIASSKTVLILLTGALCALGLYYLFLYIFTPNSSYIYYTLFVFSVALWGFYIYGGYAYYFGIFNAGPFSNAFIVILPIFTILFFKSIYKNNSLFNLYNKVLNAVFLVLLVTLIAYILVQLEYVPYFSIAKYGSLLYLISFSIILSIAIIIYMKKLPLSGIFLLAFSTNFLGSIISILFFSGKVPYNILTFYGNMIGGLIEAILLSILLTHMIKQVYKEKEDAINDVKIKDMRLGIMSETIDFIAHQWKQPLTRINSSVIIIDAITYKNNIQLEEIKEELDYIEKVTKYMSKTIDDFKNLFTVNNEKIFELNKTITHTSSIIKSTLENLDIKFTFNSDEKLFVKANKGDISQVLLILLNNSKDALIERKVQDGEIKINLFSNEKKIYLEVNDNAGGIKEENINKIFKAYYSTKNKEKGTGLGLYMAKIIIESKMKASLSVRNSEEGASFLIALKKEKEEK